MITSTETKTKTNKDNSKQVKLEITIENAPTPIKNINLNTNLLTMASKTDFPYILKECGNRLVVLEFFANWCGPCKKLSTQLDELASSYEGKILIVRADVEEFEELISEYNIVAIPSFVVIKNKKTLQQFASSNIATIDKNLQKHAEKPAPKPTEQEKKDEESNKRSSKSKKRKSSAPGIKLRTNRDQVKPGTSKNAARRTESINLNTNLLTMAHKNDFPHILRESDKRLLVVEFFATWCRPCKNLSTKLDDLITSYDGKILLVKVDVDEFEDLYLEYNVSVIPTFVLIKKEKKLGQFSSSDVAVIEKHLQKHIGKSGLKSQHKAITI